jgi:hypothetical protein
MFRTYAKCCLHLSLAAGVLFLVGCGDATTPRKVTVKVVLPSDTKLQDTDTLVVVFTPEGNGTAVTAQGNAKDGTFTTEVLPGKYKLSVGVQPYPGSKDDEKRRESFDKKLNKQYSAGSTKLSYEVTGDSSQSITLDLATGTVKKD